MTATLRAALAHARTTARLLVRPPKPIEAATSGLGGLWFLTWALAPVLTGKHLYLLALTFLFPVGFFSAGTLSWTWPQGSVPVLPLSERVRAGVEGIVLALAIGVPLVGVAWLASLATGDARGLLPAATCVVALLLPLAVAGTLTRGWRARSLLALLGSVWMLVSLLVIAGIVQRPGLVWTAGLLLAATVLAGGPPIRDRLEAGQRRPPRFARPIHRLGLSPPERLRADLRVGLGRPLVVAGALTAGAWGLACAMTTSGPIHELLAFSLVAASVMPLVVVAARPLGGVAAGGTTSTRWFDVGTWDLLPLSRAAVARAVTRHVAITGLTWTALYTIGLVALARLVSLRDSGWLVMVSALFFFMMAALLQRQWLRGPSIGAFVHRVSLPCRSSWSPASGGSPGAASSPPCSPPGSWSPSSSSTAGGSPESPAAGTVPPDGGRPAVPEARPPRGDEAWRMPRTGRIRPARSQGPTPRVRDWTRRPRRRPWRARSRREW